MSKILNCKPYYFDIESQGFVAQDDDFILACLLSEDNKSTAFKLEQLESFVEEVIGSSNVLITFNGENWSGGYDFAALRTYHLLAGTEWPFSGVRHLDIYPLISKRINTKHYEIKLPSKSSLKSKDLKELAKANLIKYTTIPETYDKLIELEEDTDEKVNWLEYAQRQNKPRNGLQDVYKMFFDPKGKEEYIDGGEIPKLYEAVLKGDKKAKIDIESHCIRDVERLKKVTELIVPTLPEWEVRRAINLL